MATAIDGLLERVTCRCSSVDDQHGCPVCNVLHIVSLYRRCEILGKKRMSDDDQREKILKLLQAASALSSDLGEQTLAQA